MRNKILFAFVILFNLSFYAQNLQWVKSFGSSGGDANSAVITDASGNVYTTGWFDGTVDFDPSASTYTLTAISGKSAFVSKFDGNGNFIWAKALLGNAEGDAIAVDAAGNVYSAGYFYNTTDFDPGVGVYNLTSNGMEDIYVCKLDPTGNFIWAKSFGSNATEEIFSIDLDLNNNVVITGDFRNTCDFDPGTSSFNLTSIGVEDIYVCKLDASGNFVWAKTIGSTKSEQSRSLVIDGSNNIYLTGYYSDIVDFDPSIAVFNLSAGGVNNTAAFICKIDASGSFVWAKSSGGSSSIVGGESIALDVNGNIFVSGYFLNTIDFDPSIAVYNLTSIGSFSNIFNLKLDATGSFIWANQISGSGNIQLGDIDTDALGNLYLTGNFKNTADFDPSGSVYNLTAPGVSESIFVCKLSSNSNFVWALQFDGSPFSYINDISIDPLNNIFIAGLFDNTVDFDPSAVVFNQTSNGSHDAYIFKLGVVCTVTSTLDAQSNVSCFGLSNGSATVSASGGSTPYTYSWSPSGGSSNIATGLSANTYTCLITDNSSCTTSKTVTITQPTILTSSISSQTNVQCNGTSTGSLALSISGGTGSYTYSWSPTGGSSSNLVNQTAGNYTCVIQDVNLCSVTQTASITQPSAIIYSIASQANVSCNGGNNGSVLINANGGTGTLTYSWQPMGGTSSTANSLSAGNYTCTIADANNCSKQQTVSITQPTPLLATIMASNNISCFGNQNGSATINASGGAGNYTYSWTPSSVGTSSTATNLSTGTYTCLVSDMNSCNTLTMLTITTPSAISSTASITNPSCTDANDGIADLSVSGGLSPYSVMWSNGSTGLQNSNLSGGTYTANITDANSCTYTVSVLVQATSNPCFFVPNGFSPNGDGINDTWVIAGINNYPNAEVTVLNRWGQVVFKTTNYSTPWDGNYNGNTLPTSDYYYIINLNDGSKALTGTLTIKR